MKPTNCTYVDEKARAKGIKNTRRNQGSLRVWVICDIDAKPDGYSDGCGEYTPLPILWAAVSILGHEIVEMQFDSQVPSLQTFLTLESG